MRFMGLNIVRARMSSVALLILLAFTVLTVVEGAIVRDYPAMFYSGICAVVFLAAWMVMLEVEECG